MPLTLTRVLSLVLALLLAALFLYFEGPAALIYAALYLLSWAPGLPIGWRLFGRTPPGWIVGAILGFGLSAMAIWVPAFLGVAHPLAFLLSWAGITAVTHWWDRAGAAPLLQLPDWTAQTSRRWLGLLLVVLLFVAPPFARVGEIGADGARRYRAYFTADFVWHMAMTEELARFEFPPTNLYLAPEPIHYYWTYFLVPAAIARPAGLPLVSVQTALKITAIATALLMFSVVFLAAWAATGRSGAAIGACLIALMAPSWEGLYTLVRFWSAGLSPPEMFSALRDLNIDAVTNWHLGGLRIDGLVRAMWWNPQHSTSLAAGVIALVIAGCATPRPPRIVWSTAGLALALSIVMSPFQGAAFCAMFGLVVMGGHFRRGDIQHVVVAQWMTVGPVALAIGWTVLNRVSENAGAAVSLGWQGLARHAPVSTLLLSLGGLLVPAAVAILPNRRHPLGAAWMAIPGVLVAWALAWGVSLTTDAAWVGFRAGAMLQVTLPILAAAGFMRLQAMNRRLAIGAGVLLLAVGAPTTLIDAFNAQDVANTGMGPAFRWTVPVSPNQWAGFRWLRQATAPTAIVQADPVVRGREQWSLIPSFGARRSAAGFPISLIAVPEYDIRSNAVHDLLTTEDLESAHRVAASLGIQYLWLDEDDAPQSAARLSTRPELFGLVFRRGAVHVFDVRPGP